MGDYWTVHGAYAPTPSKFDNEADALAEYERICADPWVEVATVIHHHVVKRFVRGEDWPNATGVRRSDKGETDGTDHNRQQRQGNREDHPQ